MFSVLRAIVLTGFLLASLAFCAKAQDANPLVQFQGTDVPLNKALLEIRKEFNVALAYDSKELRRFRVSGSGEDKRLHDLLYEWLQPIGWSYQLVGNTTVILPQEALQTPPDKDVGNAQRTLHGRILDRETREPLPFASILVEQDVRGTTANADGYFTLKGYFSDTTRIRFSFVGYTATFLEVRGFSNEKATVIELMRSSALLPVARVSSRRNASLIRSERPSLQTIDAELAYRLPNIGEPDVIRAMQLLPGVSGALENSAALHIRGGAADENLVLFDGFTIYHLDHFFGVFSAFNANSVKSIRLHKGVFDVRYGGRASGVLEVSGKSGNRYRTVVKTDLTLLSAAVHLETPVLGDRTSFLLSARRSFTDVIFSPTYRSLFNGVYQDNVNASGASVNPFGGSEAPDFHFYDVTAKLSYRSELGDLLSLSVYNGRDRLAVGYTQETVDDRLSIEYNDRSQWGNAGAGLRWSRQWDESKHTTASLGFSAFNSELFGFDSRESLLIGTRDTVFFDRSTTINDLTLRVDHHQLAGRHHFGFGGDVTVLSVNNSALGDGMARTNENNSAETIAVYASDEIALTDRWFVKPGMRTTWFTGTAKAYAEPRIRTEILVGSALRLHAAAGRHVQFIRNVRRQDLFLNTSDEWRIADDVTVPVLQNNQVSAGFTLDWKLLHFESELFYKSVDGAIEDALRFISIEPGTYPQNLVSGEGTVRGLEALLRAETETHTGWVAYTLSRARNRFEEISLEEMPSYFDRLHELKAVYSYRPGRFEANAVFVYASGLPYTAATGVYELELINGEAEQLLAFGEIYGARLPAYHRLDLSVHYRFQLNAANASVGISLYNAYNRLNVRNRYAFLAGTQLENLLIGFRDQRFLGAIPAVHFSVEW